MLTYVQELEFVDLRASEDHVKRDLEVTCRRCGQCICDAEDGDTMATLVRAVSAHLDQCTPNTAVCRFCQRGIVDLNGEWIDPEASGDDAIWRETCGDNDTERAAPHEPEI